MIKCDLHTHTIFCDGRSTAEEMVLAAIAKGMECIGFSGHSYSPGDSPDTSCGMQEDTAAQYRKEIKRLRAKYEGKIKILCGIEMDYYSENDTRPYDYIIGSVHELKPFGKSVCVDYTASMVRDAIAAYYNNDPMLFAESYYSLAGDVAEKTHCDIIGHFDLLTKFDEQDHIFDTQNTRYVKAWKSAADRLLQYDIPFEINTGAIYRGYRSSPYPSKEIIQYIKSRGGSFILSSDSHDCGALCFKFEEYADFADSCSKTSAIYALCYGKGEK